MIPTRRERFWGRAILVLAALLACGSVAHVATAGAGGVDAPFPRCEAVLGAVAAGVPGTVVEQTTEISCATGKCLEKVELSDGQEICHYARSATLSRTCEAGAKAARRIVARVLRKGWKRTKVGAGLAGIRAVSKGNGLGGGESGYLVVFNVGRAAVQLDVGASSDDDPHPEWSDARRIALKAARRLAKSERPLQCPK